MTQRIPDGYRGATPYLCIKDAARALDFYKTAFGAKEVMRMPHDDKIGHGDRLGCVDDPFGHSWSFATHVEDVSPEEMRRRAKKNSGSG